MAQMKISTLQAQTLLNAREKSSYDRKQIKKRVFAEIRAQHGIPRSTKIKLAIENPDNPLYCVIRNKHTDKPLDNGLPEPVAVVTQTSPATKPQVATPVQVETKPVQAASPAAKPKTKAPIKAPAKVAKPVAKAPAKAPAKVAKPVAKAPAKVAKPVAKAPAKVAKPVAKAPAKAQSKPSAAVAYPRELRVSIAGKRVRLGVAKSAAHEKALIAAYKKSNGIA